MNAKYITDERWITLKGKRVRIIYVDLGNLSVKEATKVIDHVKKYV